MRTINYILTLSLIFLYITTTCDAQLTNKAVPPSPNASNLGKYGDIPVGLYTGVPNISIPIWEIKERRLSLPISLSYHASGNRVDDIASWTGLGWTLNAGGVITRTVKGFPDDVVNGYRYINSAMGIYFNPVNENDFNRFVPADTTIEYKIRNLEYDTEPDLFFFNFNGYTGKFVFDGNGGILLMPQQKLKIIPKSQGIADIESWEVITEDGVHYCFGDTSATEVTHEISGIGTPMPNFNSSWYLKRIISADLTDTITFTYTKSTYGYSLPVSESANYNEVNNSYNVNGILIRGIQITGRQLDKIESATCIAKFIKTNLRSDLSEKRLDEIKIQDKSLNTVKHYKLYYNYWGTDKYLRLDSIDDDLSNSGAYKFEYYNTNNLPGRLSKSQDHWGFYNGKSNTTLIPSHGTFVGANRVPAWPEMKANILEKIIYPTGGYSLLTYEPHIFGHLGTISVNTVKYVIGKIDSISGSRPPNTVPCVKVIDTVPFSHYAVVNYYFKYVTDVLGSVSIERNGTEIWGRTINCATGDVCGTVTEDGVEYTTVYGTDSVFLASRSSHSLIVMPHVGQYAKLIIITKDTVSLPGAISKNSMAGGLRIKSRKDYNGLTDSTFVEYDYSMDSDTLRSSGCLVFIPRYSTPMDGPDFTLYTNELSTGYIKLYSSPSSYLGTTQGGHVGYGEVTVKYGRGGTNGKSKSYFYAPYDYTDGIEYDTPEPLVTSCD